MVDETDSAEFNNSNLHWTTDAEVEAQILPSKSFLIKLY